MTLPDVEDCKMPDNNKKEVKLKDTVQEVLLRAREDNRITSGVVDCANKLEHEPEMIMLCLLPNGTSDDISVSIQHKLIEAYCWENDIHVIEMPNSEKLSELVNGKDSDQKTVKENPVTSPSYDCTCVLVDFPPKGKVNTHESRLLDLMWPQQIIQLPI